MGVDPWADENDEHESRGGQGDSSDEGASELEREARRRREQFWNEGYREGLEEGKKATVQAGFNVGFREGATAGLAYGQARGVERSVRIFAGQVPGSSEWTSAVAETARLIEEMPPRDAARAAGDEFERARKDADDETRGGDARDVDENENENENDGETTGVGAFAARVRAARDELDAAGFEHRTFNVEGGTVNDSS